SASATGVIRLTKSTASIQFFTLNDLISFLSSSTRQPSSCAASGAICSWVSGGVPPRQGMHLLSARLVAIQLSTLAIVARSASSGSVSSHASQISFATASGVARRLITRMLASFHLRAPLAVSASPQRAARTLGTLLAAIHPPVPVQQNSTPCWQAPEATPSPTTTKPPPPPPPPRVGRGPFLSPPPPAGGGGGGGAQICRYSPV